MKIKVEFTQKDIEDLIRKRVAGQVGMHKNPERITISFVSGTDSTNAIAIAEVNTKDLMTNEMEVYATRRK